jgi:signal transduction histidine kinase
MLDEIYDSIDDGLENSKILIIEKVKTDSTLIHKKDFGESNYAIHEITENQAMQFRDVYMDSTFYMQNESDYEPVRILKTVFKSADGKYYHLLIASSMVEEDDLIEDLLFAVIWLYLALLGSILAINNILLRHIWRPFYDIVARLKAFRPGMPHIAAPVNSAVKEFNDLNETVSDLLQRVIDTFSSQKQFIENASHELQTPLAISINKLELLAEKNAFTDEQVNEISSVVHSLERITKLNKTLLLLSKIENKQFAEESVINFNALTNRIVISFEDLSEFKLVNVSVVEEGALKFQMNAELAEIMLTNLLKNAIIHNYPGGTIDIKIKSSKITIENTSTSDKLDASQIFKRFYKSSFQRTSTGLGLAIVKSIIDYYELKIIYEYSGKHKFEVEFKPTPIS